MDGIVVKIRYRQYVFNPFDIRVTETTCRIQTASLTEGVFAKTDEERTEGRGNTVDNTETPPLLKVGKEKKQKERKKHR